MKETFLLACCLIWGLTTVCLVFSPSPLMQKRCWQFVFTQRCANNPYHAAVKCLAGIIADRQPQITELSGFVLCTEKVWLFIVILILVVYIWHQVELV